MRKRFQKGSIQKRKGSWIGQWRENGNGKCQKLGDVKKMSKASAQVKLAEILRPINNREAVFDSTTPLEDFLDTTYFPIYKKQWKDSTYEDNRNRVRFHIRKEFGERRISSITREELQTLLEDKAKTGLSFSIVDHLRWDLKQIFTLAKNDGLIVKNPAEQIMTPRCAATPPRMVMGLEDVRKCMALLPLRDRLIFKLATLGGMRPGEILALRWKHLSGSSANIQQRIYRGKLDTPKSKKGFRQAALTDGIGEDVSAWRESSLDSQPEAWVFPSERKSSPLNRDNVWRRDMQPILEKAGLGWAGFQVMRRTHATLMNALGTVDPKLIADQMGHNLDVSQNVYTVPDIARRREAVNLLETAVQNP